MSKYSERTTFHASIPLSLGKKGDVAEIDARISINGHGHPGTIEVRALGGEEYIDISSPAVFTRNAGVMWGRTSAEKLAGMLHNVVLLWLGSRDGQKAVSDALADIERAPSPAEAKQIAALEMQRGGGVMDC